MPPLNDLLQEWLSPKPRLLPSLVQTSIITKTITKAEITRRPTHSRRSYSLGNSIFRRKLYFFIRVSDLNGQTKSILYIQRMSIHLRQKDSAKQIQSHIQYNQTNLFLKKIKILGRGYLTTHKIIVNIISLSKEINIS